MYVYLFLKMGVWVINSSIIKLLLSSNLLFSNFSCASDWRDFSDDKVPVAKAVVFLAGEDAGYITGQVLAVDGGMSM